MDPKSLVVFCPDCCRTYEKKGLQVGDIRCEDCGNHGDQRVVEVRRYEDVQARPLETNKGEPCKFDGQTCQENTCAGCVKAEATQDDGPGAVDKSVEGLPNWFTPTHKEILDLVQGEPGLSTSEIASRLKRNFTYTSMQLSNLVSARYLERRPDPKDGRAKVYYPAKGAKP